jgi:hypothetical protein
MAEAYEHPSIPDSVPTITLEEAVRMLAPHFKGDIYLIAEHVRMLVTRGDPNGVPAFNAGCGRIHPACFANGMVAVVGRYDPYDGRPRLEIVARQALNPWDWSPAANTLGRERFEKHLPGAAQKASKTVTEETVVSAEVPEPTPKHDAIVAIVRRHYWKNRKGFSAKTTLADVTRVVETGWEAECRQRGMEISEPPHRETVNEALKRTGLATPWSIRTDS